MLQVGFAEDVEIILERLPEKRQSMMFSATIPSWIRSLTKKYLNDPLTIDLMSSLVIHYELPNNTETFVHRTGRTGRAGKKGSAILIYSQDQSRAVKIIEREVGSRFTELPSIAVERGGSMFEGIGGRSGSSFGSRSGGGYGCTSGRSGNRYSSGGSDRSSQSSGRIRFGGGFGSNDGKRSY
ncbi:unnamed protein product [Brassica oleracea]